MALAANIKRLRKKKGWSQSELAEKIEFSLSHITRIETGKYNPSLTVAMKLAEVFDVSIDQLVNDPDDASKGTTIKDKALAERIKLIDSLDQEDREVLIRMADTMLTKQKILQLLTQQENSLSELTTG
jgi:transcriptional regulator with XRE-family HTH domain